MATSIVKSPLIPHRLREALEIEAGFNDGISLPLLLLFVGLSGVEVSVGGRFPWLTYTLEQIGFGVLSGLVIGWLDGWLMTRTEKRGWMFGEARQQAMLAVALLSWWVGGNLLPGNGFIAAFVAGGAMRYTYAEAQLEMKKFNSVWGYLLGYLVLYGFGMIAAPVLGLIPGVIWLFAILSLLAFRMLAVRIAMIGAELKSSAVAYLGWFGPRGLASVVLGIIYLNRVPQIDANSKILQAMIATVFLSVFAHGITANPLIKLYARKGEGISAGPTSTPAE